ncbi:MAG: class II fructose-bisphosphatase [Chloroflexi bacterium]|nr:class II fructose-bisphosphatase [Chloroflexota bacterium]MBI5964519.1 class II fructose-bisphosphatase [Chloroflexota bacterium]
MSERPQRNLSLELVRATEAAALVAARYRDLGKWDSANSAAATAMRLVLQTIDMDGVIVGGEGEKHNTPLLFHGEMVGTGHPPAVDVAVDPIEGSPARALGRPNTLALAALAERWSLWDPGPSVYVEEIVTGSAARAAIDLNLSPAENMRRIAEALQCKVGDLTVFVLDKPRHENLIRELNETGAHVKLNSGGFIVGAMLAAMPGTGVDVMMSIGRASESVLAACAVKALDGGLQIRRAPQSDEEMNRVHAALGKRAGQILTEADVCKSEDVFLAATGITDGGLLHGVEIKRDGVTTESLVMRARSGTMRYVRAIHRLDKLMQFSQIDYTGGNQEKAEDRG